MKLLDLQIYERMRSRAGARAAERESAITLDEQRIGALADCTPDAEVAALAVVTGVKHLRKHLHDAEAAVRTLEEEAAAASRAVETARQVVGLLEAVKVPKAVLTLNKQRDAALTAARRSRGRSGRLRRCARRAREADRGASRSGPAPTSARRPRPARRDPQASGRARRRRTRPRSRPSRRRGPRTKRPRTTCNTPKVAFEAAVEDSAATASGGGTRGGRAVPGVRAGGRAASRRSVRARRSTQGSRSTRHARREATARSALEKVEAAARENARRARSGREAGGGARTRRLRRCRIPSCSPSSWPRSPTPVASTPSCKPRSSRQ